MLLVIVLAIICGADYGEIFCGPGVKSGSRKVYESAVRMQECVRNAPG